MAKAFRTLENEKRLERYPGTGYVVLQRDAA